MARRRCNEASILLNVILDSCLRCLSYIDTLRVLNLLDQLVVSSIVESGEDILVLGC